MSICSLYACLVANADIKFRSIFPEIHKKFFKGGKFFSAKLLWNTLWRKRSTTLIQNAQVSEWKDKYFEINMWTKYVLKGYLKKYVKNPSLFLIALLEF